jgi:hypothetical protein
MSLGTALNKCLEKRDTYFQSVISHMASALVEKFFRIRTEPLSPPTTDLKNNITEVDSMYNLFKKGLMTTITGLCIGLIYSVTNCDQLIVVSALITSGGGIIMMLSVLGEQNHDGYE